MPPMVAKGPPIASDHQPDRFHLRTHTSFSGTQSQSLDVAGAGSGLLPIDVECFEGEGGEECFRASVVPGCGAPPVLKAAEHDHDAVAAFVALFVVADGCLALLPARHAGAYPLSCNTYLNQSAS